MTIDEAQDICEKVIIETAPEEDRVANPYMAGYIDALFDQGLISKETRDKLYNEYS